MNLVNIPIALGAGVLSISSPCCIPLLPGLLGYLGGSAADAENRRGRTVLTACLFVLGFTIVFAGLGATASGVGHFLLGHRSVFSVVGGSFILLVGLTLLLEGRITVLARGGDWTRGWRPGGLWGAVPLGAAFAISWTPCIGPVLGGVLTLAGSTGRVGEGVFLLCVYSLGLGLPLIAMSMSLHRVRPWLARARRRARALRLASGAALSVMGVLLVTNLWVPLMAPLLALYARAQWPPV